MSNEKMVSAEEARGCGDGGCVFRAPSSKGQHTNAGCRCLPLRMTPAERVGLREQIRSLVVELDEARERAERAARERDELRAARRGYASEFPRAVKPDPAVGTLVGDLDVGNIHANIRALKAERDRLAREVEALEDAGDDGWIAWEGGDCPVLPDALVEIVLRDGTLTEDTAGNFGWGHHDTHTDIIEYRVVPADEEEQPPTTPEGRAECSRRLLAHLLREEGSDV